MNPVIATCTLNSPYGFGIDACWEALMEGRSAIRYVERFDRDSFVSNLAAMTEEVPESEDSRVWGLTRKVADALSDDVPMDSALLMATTTGEIEHVERAVDGEEENAERSDPSHLLARIQDIAGVQGECAVISSACSSSAIALIRAVQRIRHERDRSVLVVGCDGVSEFVHAGFCTLMALSSRAARPFDADRDGLTLGEGAAGAVVCSPQRAEELGSGGRCSILGTGMTCDANHMTGPSRDGEGLARAVDRALDEAQLGPADVDCICAHGTGTVYNDSMEMKAFKRVFGEEPVPTFSIKGATGHTMGAAGLLEILIAARSVEENVIPPTVGMENPDEEAAGWVRSEPVEANVRYALCVNSGFGGVNSAVVIGTAVVS